MHLRPKSITSVAIKAANGTDEPTKTVKAKKTIGFAALVTHADKTTSVTTDAAWKSSDTGKATFTKNVLTGVAAGTTNITATVDGVTSPQIQITVTAE